MCFEEDKAKCSELEQHKMTVTVAPAMNKPQHAGCRQGHKDN